MSPTDRIPSPAEESASLWAARLDGGVLSKQEQAELEAWLAEGPDRRALLEAYCEVSAELDQVLPALAAGGRMVVPPRARPARARWTPGWVAAGAFAAAAVAAAAVWMGWPGARPERMASPVAQRRAFTLADGTRVELNANTSILVENGRAERRVRLADGEAFFEVTKDKARPFIVETPAGSVRVTGTRFDVRTEAASELVVTVVEGSVQVRTGDAAAAQPAEPVALGPGDRLDAGKAGVRLSALSSGSLDDALAWRDGQIVFHGVPLSQALAQFARYHGRTLTATDGAATLRISARMRLDDLDGFFASLEKALPQVRVERDADGGARVSLRAEK